MLVIGVKIKERHDAMSNLGTRPSLLSTWKLRRQKPANAFSTSHWQTFCRSPTTPVATSNSLAIRFPQSLLGLIQLWLQDRQQGEHLHPILPREPGWEEA